MVAIFNTALWHFLLKHQEPWQQILDMMACCTDIVWQVLHLDKPATI